MQKIVVVTGGTRGIGAAISSAFAAAGHLVIATYHHDDAVGLEFAANSQIIIKKWDVADFAACQENMTHILHEYKRVDVLVNNAGITRDSLLRNMSLAAWCDVINTNLSSVFNMCKQVIDSMISAKSGRIINIGSINGHKGQRGQCNYAATKAAMIGFTKSLAQEVAAYRVTANVIAPGYIDTKMVRALPDHILSKVIEQIPARRLGNCQEIAALALFLASDDAQFINGAVLDINGGQW